MNVDMFNDEISDVRINAIHTLRKIGTRWYLELNEEDLEIVASTLEDAHGGTRHATHDLMGFVYISMLEWFLYTDMFEQGGST